MRIYRFEGIDESLPLLPLAARRALDAVGLKLSLRAWQGLSLDDRVALVEQGSAVLPDESSVRTAVAEAEPPAEPIEADDFSRLGSPPDATLADAWAGLDGLARFALAHLVKRGDRRRFSEARQEICGALTHLDETGAARMVDVGEKQITHRVATAQARVRMRAETAAMVRDHSGPKGDVLATARLAGIMASKRTPELIPLCHGIALTKAAVSFDIDVEEGLVTVLARTEARDRTGVEMEAMVAASVAALTVYDMLKAVERDMVIEEVVLLEKAGGKSGPFVRGNADASDRYS